MKGTTHFTQTIQNYLEQRAASDELFATVYAKPNKNIDNCITYIFNTVQKSGCNGFTDDEIYSMAIHYYDEDSIEIGNPINCHVVVNHTVELTEEEKQEARKEAIQRAHDEAYQSMKKSSSVSKNKKNITNNQPNLFDL